jgi:hypothetical protein
MLSTKSVEIMRILYNVDFQGLTTSSVEDVPAIRPTLQLPSSGRVSVGGRSKGAVKGLAVEV